MKKANISKIKSELSKYIRFAKAGEEVVIMDRDQPVAKIVGINSDAHLQISEPLLDLRTVLLRADKRTFSEKTDIFCQGFGCT